MIKQFMNLVITCVLCSTHHGLVIAQSRSLDTPITTNLADTTLRALCADISRKTGIKVEPTKAVADRHLIVHLTNLPIRDLLDAVTEMTGLTWKSQSSGRILVDRKIIDVPKKLAEFPDKFRLAMPPELYRFLGIGVPEDELTPIPNERERRAVEMQKKQPNYVNQKAIVAAQFKIKSIQTEARESLKSLITKESYRGKRLTLKEMSPDAKSALVRLMAITAFVDLDSQSARYYMDALFPFQSDPTKAVIYSNKSLDSLTIGGNVELNGFKVFSGVGGALGQYGNPLKPKE